MNTAVKILIQLTLLLPLACTTANNTDSRADFASTIPTRPAPIDLASNGCFIVMDFKSGKIITQNDAKACAERVSPCSTFKIPLALMGFDFGTLKDETTGFKWDGTRRSIEAWNKDHTARTWLRDSVVWYSQRLTPLIGMKSIRNYLKDFDYGNQDFSGGLTQAWLASSLKISPREQVEFLRRLVNHKLKLKPEAIDKTLAILPVEVDEPGKRIAGKTGTGDLDPQTQVGWYVGVATLPSGTYVFARVLKIDPTQIKDTWASKFAKASAIQNLNNLK